MSFREMVSWIPVLALVALPATMCSLCARLSGTSRDTRRRVLFAAAIAPLAVHVMVVIASFGNACWMLLAGYRESPSPFRDLFLVIPWTLFRLSFGAYVGALIVGAPLFLLLWRFEKMRWIWALGAGLLGGAVSFVPFRGVSSASAPQLLFEILTGAVGGAAIALTFWWIAVRGNEELATRPRSCNSACNSGNDGSV